jgi:hypothetical protein
MPRLERKLVLHHSSLGSHCWSRIIRSQTIFIEYELNLHLADISKTPIHRIIRCSNTAQLKPMLTLTNNDPDFSVKTRIRIENLDVETAQMTSAQNCQTCIGCS